MSITSYRGGTDRAWGRAGVCAIRGMLGMTEDGSEEGELDEKGPGYDEVSQDHQLPPELPLGWHDLGNQVQDGALYREFLNPERSLSIRFDTEVYEVFLIRMDRDERSEWTATRPLTAIPAETEEEAVSVANRLMDAYSSDDD